MRGRRAGWLCAIAMACAVWALLTNRALVADATQPGDAAARTADGFLRAVGPRDWSFPRDHGRHDGFKTEWWYFTGNLYESEAGAATQGANAEAAPVTTGARRFGYQLTFFRTSLTASAATRPSPWAMRDLYSAHAAVTDVAGGRFLCDDISSRGRPDLAWAATGNLDVKVLDWSAVLQSQDSGGAGAIHLKAGGEGFSYDLICAAGGSTGLTAGEPVLEGPGGVNAKGPLAGEASYYYSMIRMATGGRMTIGGKSFDVGGLTWMDHEFSSNPLGPDQVGWDWMGLTLDDGREVMVYRLRNAAGASAFASATVVAADGGVTYIDGSKIHMTGSQPWHSATTGADYPQEWRVEIDGMKAMEVRSVVADQELHTPHSTDVDYYEGASDVVDESGKKIGQGYLEMTGYSKPVGMN